MPEDIAGITRDWRYHWTYWKDSWRYRFRRWVHRIRAVWSEQFIRPVDKAIRIPNRPTITTIIPTMNSAGRIQPLLAYCRSFSDQIVVAIDAKTTDNTLEVCKALADVVFVAENNAKTGDALVGVAVEHATGDWVLRLDDDEFPETQLVASLPYWLTRPDVTHYKIPRVHLSQHDPLCWVDDGYLYPDHQMRLFINRPEWLSFPDGKGHGRIACHRGKLGRINGQNLVHLNLAMNPRRERFKKLQRRYVARMNGGWVHPVNEHTLLFEDFHYNIRPYRSGNEAFDQLLRDTIAHQRQLFDEREDAGVVW